MGVAGGARAADTNYELRLQLRAVLIMLPERFIHDVQTPTDVQNINKSATQMSSTQFPVAAGSDWAWPPEILLRCARGDYTILIVMMRCCFCFATVHGYDHADTQYTDRIKIYLDDTGGGQAIDPGEYRFSFPALVPPSMSNNNYWSISLCFDRDCQQPDGQHPVQQWSCKAASPPLSDPRSLPS
ncbi:unnamed protein product [Symbiodinium necroappetens]|uniref:Uncharacterized protein n=1 Tax=Symbiodinium necroappetens TaxID=1628268 RepID=A0A812MCP6_9DINO|nr:unnamed protein product [Symbiodinium necroappetens]